MATGKRGSAPDPGAYDMTQYDIADALGIYQSSVDYAEKQAMEKMRERLLKMANRNEWLEGIGYGNRQSCV